MTKSNETIFLGCGFAAKYQMGGGNFSVPLQWALGLKRLGKDFFWLEILPASKDPNYDRLCIRSFQLRLRQHGLENNYVLLYQKPKSDLHDLAQMEVYGALTKSQLLDRLAGPNILLNLSYSIHPPLLMQFDSRKFCDLDPTEISYWMQKMEMGQSYHHEFWTIGQNVGQKDCAVATNNLKWKTFFPLVDTELNFYSDRPKQTPTLFTTIGQWYWVSNIELNGGYPDLSKGIKFEKFLKLPSLVPEIEFQLAMNFGEGDGEKERMEANGWKTVSPHKVAKSPLKYRQYLRNAAGEFTTIKGVDELWKSGWLSDRAAAFMSMGRPVVTEDAAVGRSLPSDCGFYEIHNAEEAAETLKRINKEWDKISKRARECAVENFEASRVLKRILSQK